MRRSIAILWAVLSARCTSTDLYSVSGDDSWEPDRLRLEGTLCTEDPASAEFPLKILFLTDSTVDMALADPEGYRICGGTSCSPGSLQALVDRCRGLPNVRLGFVSVAAQSVPIPPPDGQRFFMPQDPEVAQAIGYLQTPQDAKRDIESAIAQVQAFVSADIARSSPGEVLRTRYVVHGLFAGPPTSGEQDPGTLAAQVQAVQDFVYAQGALELRFNLGLVYFGSLTPSCYPAEPAGSCLCVPDESLYCQATCATASIDDSRNDRARAVYGDMAYAGEGRFRELACPAAIDWGVEVATSSVNLVKKDIVAFNRNARLTPQGSVADSDGDGLSDAEERAASPATDPRSWDTDGDGLGDMLESRAYPRQDPTDPSDRPLGCGPVTTGGAIVDRDLDLLNDCEEGLLQTSPTIPDSDGDGLPDALELWSGTLPSVADRLLDPDGDGFPNGIEVSQHTDPQANDGPARGRDAYSVSIGSLGLRSVATMEDPPELPGVTFRSASESVVGGRAYLRWDACAGTLEWSDARVGSIPPFTPVPVPVAESGVYRLTASSPIGEDIWIDVEVTRPLLPRCDVASQVIATPLVSVSMRNCYDVRIGNIKLVETLPSNGDPRPGINHVLVFFTQAPDDRLTSPGITKMASIEAQLTCSESDGRACTRRPADAVVELTDDAFISLPP